MVLFLITITTFVRLVERFLFYTLSIYLCVIVILMKIFVFQTIFPSEGWWVVPAKVVFDQTVWAAIWNSIYFIVLGFLRFESPSNLVSELKTTFWPLLTVSIRIYFSVSPHNIFSNSFSLQIYMFSFSNIICTFLGDRFYICL